MPIDFINDCTPVLYKQLIQTGFGCFPSDFTLCRDFLSTRTQILGEPPHTALLCVGGVASGRIYAQPARQACFYLESLDDNASLHKRELYLINLQNTFKVYSIHVHNWP